MLITITRLQKKYTDETEPRAFDNEEENANGVPFDKIITRFSG